MTVNETKVLFAEKTCHKNLLPGLQIPYKFFPKSFLMLFKAIFRLRNISPHKSMDRDWIILLPPELGLPVENSSVAPLESLYLIGYTHFMGSEVARFTIG